MEECSRGRMSLENYFLGSNTLSEAGLAETLADPDGRMVATSDGRALRSTWQILETLGRSQQVQVPTLIREQNIVVLKKPSKLLERSEFHQERGFILEQASTASKRFSRLD